MRAGKGSPTHFRLACRADNKMLLINVVRDDTTKEPVIERRTYMCSACRHIVRRLVFSRAKMPITHLPDSGLSPSTQRAEPQAPPLRGASARLNGKTFCDIFNSLN
jgi:hypothetical protein